MLEQQQLEREDDSFHHGCMFCSQEFTGNRCPLVDVEAEMCIFLRLFNFC